LLFLLFYMLRGNNSALQRLLAMKNHQRGFSSLLRCCEVKTVFPILLD
jgi:hypothetical protein